MSHFRVFALGTTYLYILGLVLVGVTSAQTPIDPNTTAQLEEYCVGCHNSDDYAGSLDLSAHLADADVSVNTQTWEKVIRKLRAGMMPPPGQPRPDWNSYSDLTSNLENIIDSTAAVNPGTLMLHRLNRVEYANAVRELLAVDIDSAAMLPPDTSARGFDNNAGSLTISPTLLEAYTTAAAKIARIAVGFWNSPTEAVYIAAGDTSQNQQLDGMPFGTRGGLAANHTFQADGDYTFYIQNFGVGNYIAGEKLELSIDGERVHLFEYAGVGLNEGGNADKDGALEITLPVTAGSHLIGATFLLSNYRPSLDTIQPFDRLSLDNESFPQVLKHPVIGLMKVLGPFNAQRPQDSASLRKVFTCQPTNADQERSCAIEIFSTLSSQAYRRPITALDVDTLLEFYDMGRSAGTFNDGIELGLRRMLIDPEFLVRTEHEPQNLTVGQSYLITDLELASRLSFFLWSSIPDAELLSIASAGQLSEPATLEQQVRRMLDDPRSDALVKNFAQQWLYLRNLPATSPDGIFYPNWDDELRQGFVRETELLFESIVREDRSVIDLLDADYTFVNERLAKHYGMPNIYGSHFRRVDLGSQFDYRRGLLGQGSFLSVTYTQNFRTSPVKRGVWVLENILGTPPPEPPPNVPALEETANAEHPIRTLRDQLTLHRQEEPCATCHKIMDGIGFALANFEADASWTTLEGHPRKGDGTASPIDAAVELWDGTRANGPTELRETLLRYSPQFVRFVTEKLMTYGLGRGVEYYDMPVIRSIVKSAESENYRFSALVLGIVNSPAFQRRVKQME
jgi:Protein of unknown function (DUF1592)/Protein of unknown function (DUF1588)/Protein of unknown function (DUF1585)/Protein of unknown function (DUF1587)/Protein of unknown function (DUF1595)/Planctomycete cytochrome C